MDLKKSGVEKQRLGRERERMAEEDRASLAMRVEEQKQKQLEVLKQQMLLMGGPVADEGDEDDEGGAEAEDPDIEPEVGRGAVPVKQAAIACCCCCCCCCR